MCRTLARISLAVLGMAVVAALASLAARAHWQLRGGDSYNARTIAQDGPPQVPMTGAREGRPTSARAIVATEKPDAAREMFLQGLSKDFGLVPRGTHLVHRFPIVNIHPVPITIAYLQPSCGCISAFAGRSVLDPGESSTIQVTIDTGRFIGPAFLNVRVKVAAKDWESTCRLQLSTVSHAEVVLDPGRLDFGKVPHGEAVTHTVDIKHYGAADWQVTEAVVARDAPFVAELRELYRRDGQVGYRLAVTLKANAAIGPVQGYLYLKTNDPVAPVLVVPLNGSIRPVLAVAPDTLDLSTVTAGEIVTRRVVVRADRPFHIMGVEAGDGVSIHVDQAPVPAAVQAVVLHCTFTRPGPFQAPITIHTDLSENPPTVMLQGSVARQP